MWDKGTTSFFYMWISSSLRIICWRDYSFPIEYSWHPYWKCVGFFQDPSSFFFFSRTLNSIWLVYMSIHMLGPHCFDYCSFVVSFEMRKCGSSNFDFLFKRKEEDSVHSRINDFTGNILATQLNLLNSSAITPSDSSQTKNIPSLLENLTF